MIRRMLNYLASRNMILDELHIRDMRFLPEEDIAAMNAVIDKTVRQHGESQDIEHIAKRVIRAVDPYFSNLRKAYQHGMSDVSRLLGKRISRFAPLLCSFADVYDTRNQIATKLRTADESIDGFWGFAVLVKVMKKEGLTKEGWIIRRLQKFLMDVLSRLQPVEGMMEYNCYMIDMMNDAHNHMERQTQSVP